VSKKQIRLSDPTQIRKRAPEFINKQISLVLIDNTPLLGELKKATEHELLLSNGRLKEIRVPLEKVVDFFSDIDA